MQNKKIVIFGEALVDWTCLNKTLDLNKANEFMKLPGGAPANVSVGLAKLGYPVCFAGGFSDDVLGKWLKEYLTAFNVDLSISQDIENSNTRCAYVLTDETGNRVFKGFTKSMCADLMLDVEKIDLNILKESSIIYFGSIIQSEPSLRKGLTNILKNTDNIKVYDPNLRLAVWNSQEEAVSVIKETINYVDILKLSDDEVNLISGIENDIEAAAKKVFDEYDLKLLVITMGDKGSFFIDGNKQGFVKPFKVESYEMTGAGDGFVSGLLSGIYDNGIKNLTKEQIIDILTRANAIGALATTKPGAMTALPTKTELEEFLSAKIK